MAELAPAPPLVSSPSGSPMTLASTASPASNHDSRPSALRQGPAIEKKDSGQLHRSRTNPDDRAPRARPQFLRTRSQRPADAASNPASPLGFPTQQGRRRERPRSEDERTDALWAEMQATLAEVELSAARGTHFFGPEHLAALDDLRSSQIALAQAWARGEADEAVDGSAEPSPGASVRGGGAGPGADAETEADFLLARKRREANDRYFRRISKGVLDAVGRLEDVAAAVGKVQSESRSIWSESDSVEVASSAT